MRFYTKQHQFSCGIDVHARTMYVCILDHHGEILLPRTMPARPETWLKAMAPYRDDISNSRRAINPSNHLAIRIASS